MSFEARIGLLLAIWGIALLFMFGWALGKEVIGRKKARKARRQGESFNGEDFLSGAKRAYESGFLSQEKYRQTEKALSAKRVEPTETKVVNRGENIYDYYIDYRLWLVMKELGAEACAQVISQIPGLKNLEKAGLLSVARTMEGMDFDAKNGAVFRLKETGEVKGTENRRYDFRILSIAEQEF